MSGFPIDLALPDLWQQEAVRHLLGRRDVIVDAPTGAGKTHVFELFFKGGNLNGQVIYTVPTRALANDKRMEWLAKGWQVGIATGDVAEELDAPVVVATLETQRESFLSGHGPRLLVIDEYQMLSDPMRGLAYELALALAPKETQLLLLSGSVGNPHDIAEWLRRLGRQVEVVSTKTRPVPLEEAYLETLARRAPRKASNFWPRVAGDVLGNKLGPLLIFAPHRLMAEKIARQIAAQLPTPETLVLTEKQEQVLGAPLSTLVHQRVAYHHSGLTYAQRAGVIEPLAKAGQLRVVVATMGLAAGINFSMRSVMVAETIFFDGKVEREITPDELLQMFGRAGRRGKDEVGYVIVAERSPRLSDASHKQLRRTNQVDWPTLLRVMHKASSAGNDTFLAAENLCSTLFSKQHLILGFEKTVLSAVSASHGGSHLRGIEAHQSFGIGPTRSEIFNSRGEWETRDMARFTDVPLAQAKIYFKNHLEHALHVYLFVNQAFKVGRVCKVDKNHGNWVYGKEIPLAIERQPRQYQLTKNVRELTGFPIDQIFSYDQLDDQVLPALTNHLCRGRVAGIVQRGEILSLQIDFSFTHYPAYFDTFDVPIVSPDERNVAVEVVPSFQDETGAVRMAPSNTAAYAWRKLGLMDDHGVPTQRGIIFSYFQSGEGLAIAAALEDESYPLEELVLHLANLRGGHRFQELPQGIGSNSERLAAACMNAYGAANYEGYLDMGLPIGYAEGVADVLEEFIENSSRRRVLISEHFGEGDFERALVEWLSLLRQIKYSPHHDWDRWSQFQVLCAAQRDKHVRLLPARELPLVSAAQMFHHTNHAIFSA